MKDARFSDNSADSKFNNQALRLFQALRSGTPPQQLSNLRSSYFMTIPSF